jgi:UDP-galactopyranose mutase
MWTFSKLWNINKPEEALQIIESQSSEIKEPQNLEEQAIKLVGVEVYEKLIKGYTQKQWKKHPKFLPKEIIKRLPVRFTYDNSYFDDKYQGIPIGGYTQLFYKLLEGIEVKTNTDYFLNKNEFDKISKKIIYTGPIDKFFNYRFGELEYKTTKFDHELLNIQNFQGTAVMNFTDLETPYTRIIEHKHFENSDSDVTWITKEYPIDYEINKTEPYYPVNDFTNNMKYKKYYELSKIEDKILFGGRLAEYKYYDMHNVIDSALKCVEKLKCTT